MTQAASKVIGEGQEQLRGWHGSSFPACHKSLSAGGRLVVVFAHKQPDAWETLVSAIIRAGFVVDGSWPIQTEKGARIRALSSAALSSSVWLVCKKRPATARPGWDNVVLDEMRDILHGERDADGRWTSPSRLHQFWDAGIRGPDFVWAATGPAMEAYSKHPVVRKANEPGASDGRVRVPAPCPPPGGGLRGGPRAVACRRGR